MKVSLNWLKEYLDFELPPVDELVVRIGSQLGEVKEVVDLGVRYRGVVVVKVVECDKLENSDHLNRCLVDDNGVTPDVERNEQGLVQVITGAPNVYASMMAVWLPPGTTVPESFSKEPFVLTSRPMRGALSHGMLASSRELAIGDAHEGLLDLTDEKVKPGADFAKVFGLDDFIIDIENKMFTHRPDCFGLLGLAREVAGILGHEFKAPSYYYELKDLSKGTGLEFKIINEIPEKVPRFIGIALKDVHVHPSPLWLQVVLARVGVRPISNVVDITNYTMLLTGQPLHAYDYDKVGSATLGARQARPSEKLLLLNGKTIELDESDMVITDGTVPIGLAGIMGGASTEVSEETKNIILECATFDMYTIRRSSMRHGLFTDAVSRFNKGQSPLQNAYVAQAAVGFLGDISGGEPASPLIDDDHTGGRTSVHPPVPVTPTYINERLGLTLGPEDIKRLLQNVECRVDSSGDELIITAPYWRTDIELREDVVEEVGRLYGLDKVPLELPERTIEPGTRNELLDLKAAIRANLAKAGASEVLNYSFVHGDLIKKAGQDTQEAFQLSNALSPDLQHYRLSLTPSLLAAVHPNIKAGYDQFALYEIGKAHGVSEVDGEGIPREFGRVALVVAADPKLAKTTYAGAPYYQARLLATELLGAFGVNNLTYVPLDEAEAELQDHKLFVQLCATFESSRSAVLYDGERLQGVVGEYKLATARALKLPDFCAGFELFLSAFSIVNVGTYTPLSRFPRVTQDITLKTLAETPYQEVFRLLETELAKLIPDQMRASLQPLDIYRRADDDVHQQITWHLNVTSYERTLNDAEVNDLLDSLAAAAATKFGAERM